MRLDSLLTSILPTPLTVSALLLCLASALVLGILTALVFTRGCRHTASFALTLALLPMSVALVIMMVNGSIGTGLAVAGRGRRRHARGRFRHGTAGRHRHGVGRPHSQVGPGL